MHNALDQTETKKLIVNIKISSILIQLTFLAFPLSIYIVYNKIIANHNPDAILIVVLFLIIVLLIQLFLKITETIQKNILKTNLLIQDQDEFINNKLSNNNSFKVSELSELTKKSTLKIQDHVASGYNNFLIVYFILILIIGKFIVIIPAIFFAFNFFIAKMLNTAHDQAVEKFNKLHDIKTLLIKELLAKNKEIKGLNLSEFIVNKYNKISFASNKYKNESLYYKSILLRISVVINMINIAFILIFGRYLHSLGLISVQATVTCSLLTVWISRSIGQIFANITAKKNTSDLTEKPIKLLDNKSTTVTQEQFEKIQQELEKFPIVFCKQSSNIDLKKLQSMYQNIYLCIAYINNDFKLFYGSILDNLTLFNPSMYQEAKNIISQFNINYLINNVPYQLNYVTTGTNDDVIPYDLLIIITVVRELIKKPDLIILDINSDEISPKIKKSLFNYLKDHQIKLIIKQSDFDLKKLTIN